LRNFPEVAVDYGDNDNLRIDGPLAPYQDKRVQVTGIYDKTATATKRAAYGATLARTVTLLQDVEVGLPDGTTLDVGHCWVQDSEGLDSSLSPGDKVRMSCRVGRYAGKGGPRHNLKYPTAVQVITPPALRAAREPGPPPTTTPTTAQPAPVAPQPPPPPPSPEADVVAQITAVKATARLVGGLSALRRLIDLLQDGEEHDRR
jgi:hypothetical protein